MAPGNTQAYFLLFKKIPCVLNSISSMEAISRMIFVFCFGFHYYEVNLLSSDLQFGRSFVNSFMFTCLNDKQAFEVLYAMFYIYIPLRKSVLCM
jgi:hypothetical protein